MVAQQAKREEIDRVFVESLTERAEECLEVFRFVKDILLVVPAIDCVINLPRFVGAFRPRHHFVRQGDSRRPTNTNTDPTRAIRPPPLFKRLAT